ncbi:MAG TPA: hypothetical protein VLC95_19595 [Anaerolineae bacterium]|nr:hypothetical protein [Anaerolineae bacterium]
MGTRGVWLAAALYLAVVGLLPGAAVAQQENHAGLVIHFAEGRTETWCVPFEGETISGDDLLARSELEILIDPSSGMGITVCRIEGLGCDYPAQHCFCQCMGGEGCAYWNYFYRDPGDDTWTYSALGALLREVPPGGMEAWVWGDGSLPPASELTLEAVCTPPAAATEPAAAQPAATEAPTAAFTEVPPATATNTPAAPAGTAAQAVVGARNTPTLEASMATVPPTVLAPAETVVARTEAQGERGSYWAFGLIVAVLIAVGLAVLLRQRRGRRA